MLNNDAIALSVSDHDFVDRFWKKVDQSGECWEWTAAHNAFGYGKIGIAKYRCTAKAHRVSWTMSNGRIPEGLFVCHRCDNPKCVRPDHLFLGTPLDNASDCAKKGRVRNGQISGESHGRSVLSSDDVRSIRSRRALGESIRSIANDFPVTRTAVRSAANGRNWTHLH